jgi:hypothetical protein
MKRLCSIGLVVVLLCLTALNCKERTPPLPAEEQESMGPAWLEDVTERVGLDFVHDAGPLDGKFFMPQIVGSGAAFFDFDGDGLLDVYLLQNGGLDSKSRNRLYRQIEPGRFEVVKGSGLEIAGWSMGVAVGDVNNDGRPDVLVTQYGGVKLFLNEGKGRFTEITRQAGLNNPVWGTSAAFFDYDRDGWLDCVVVNYVDYDPTHPCFSAGGQRDYCHPRGFGGRSIKLFRNLGLAPGERQVCFEDVTVPSGLNRYAGRPSLPKSAHSTPKPGPVVGWLFPLESGGRETYNVCVVFYPAPPVDSANTATRSCLGDPSQPFGGLHTGGGEVQAGRIHWAPWCHA